MILITRLWAIISGSKLLWKVIRNYAVLSDALKGIEGVVVSMSDDSRGLPNQEESNILLLSFSNILKTEIIDIPGVDEYQLAIGLDSINTNMQLSITDTKNGKFHKIPIVKGK